MWGTVADSKSVFPVSLLRVEAHPDNLLCSGLSNEFYRNILELWAWNSQLCETFKRPEIKVLTFIFSVASSEETFAMRKTHIWCTRQCGYTSAASVSGYTVNNFLLWFPGVLFVQIYIWSISKSTDRSETHLISVLGSYKAEFVWRMDRRYSFLSLLPINNPHKSQNVQMYSPAS